MQFVRTHLPWCLVALVFSFLQASAAQAAVAPLDATAARAKLEEDTRLSRKELAEDQDIVQMYRFRMQNEVEAVRERFSVYALMVQVGLEDRVGPQLAGDLRLIGVSLAPGTPLDATAVSAWGRAVEDHIRLEGENLIRLMREKQQRDQAKWRDILAADQEALNQARQGGAVAPQTADTASTCAAAANTTSQRAQGAKTGASGKEQSQSARRTVRSRARRS